MRYWTVSGLVFILNKEIFIMESIRFIQIVQGASQKLCRVVSIFTAQLHSRKPECRFCAGSNPACGVLEIRDGEDLWQWSLLEIRLNTYCRSTIYNSLSSLLLKTFKISHFTAEACKWIASISWGTGTCLLFVKKIIKIDGYYPEKLLTIFMNVVGMVTYIFP